MIRERQREGTALAKKRGVYGHREDVLKRDDYPCRVPGCSTIKRGERSVAVHHREPGNSDPAKMLTLCLSCHAKVTRTLFVRDDLPEFLRVLWREQHPEGHEQVALNFGALSAPARNVMLFEETKAREAQGTSQASFRKRTTSYSEPR